MSTCNRAELYVACDDVDGDARRICVRFVSEFHGVAPADIAPHIYDVTDLDVARHLFRVAAGLDSLVVGEPQILGQVKDAHTVATDAHTVGPGAQPPVPRVVRRRQARAHRDRRSARARCRSATPRSRSRARSSATSPAAASLVIGAGEMGKLTALHMKSQGVQHVTIVSRTMAHAARTAEAIGGASAAPWDELDAVLGASDIVITATGAASPILTKAHIEAVMRPRRNRPLFIIDIAMPRDVEAGGRRNRAGVPLQHRRPAGDRARKPRAPRQRGRARRGDRRRGGREVRRRGSGRAAPSRPSSRCVSGSRAIRRAELERLDFKLSALPPGSARARRRNHAPHRREAAADADRAAEGARRCGDGRRVLRGADPAVRAAPTTAGPEPSGNVDAVRPRNVEPRSAQR